MLNLVMFFVHAFAAQLFVSDTVCLVCLDNPVTTIFRPCGHFCACDECATQLKEKPCPICRVEVSGIMSTDTSDLHNSVSAILWSKAFYQQCVPNAYKYRPNHEEHFNGFLKKYKQRPGVLETTSKEDEKTGHMSMFKYYFLYEVFQTIQKLGTK